MKIVEQTDNKLVLAERPYIFAGLLAVFSAAAWYGVISDWSTLKWPQRAILIFWGLSIPAILKYMVHWVWIEFDKTLNRITIWRTGIGYRKHERYPLKSLHGVRVDQGEAENSTSRIVLSLDEDYLSTLPAAERAKLARNVKRGFRTVAANDVPLTRYYSARRNENEIAKTILTWAKA